MSQSKLRIIKDTRYSAGQWRVVDETGEAIHVPKVLDLEAGWSLVMMPLCEDTKESLIGEVLDLLVAQDREIKRLKSQGN
jgi:hypothetical protein